MGFYCIYLLNSLHLTGSSGTIIQDLDLGIAISAAADSNFDIIKAVVKQIVEKYGQGKVRYGLIVFGDTATIKISFRDSLPDQTLKALIKATPNSKGGPMLDKTLKKAKELFGQSTRAKARKVFVVFMDKMSTSKPDEEKTKLDALTENKVHPLFVLWGSDSVDTGMNLVPSENIVTVNTTVTTPQPKDIAEKVVQKVLTGW